MELAYEHMNNPQLIKIEPDKVTAERVRQVVYYPANTEKIPLLLGLLRSHTPLRTIVFVNTKQNAEKLTAYLTANGFKTALLSGDVPQQKRQSLLKGFMSNKYPILVATDVASRGLHIPEVSHVINFDLPQSEEDYVHRIGRTARVGLEGDAISFACEDYAFCLPDIENYIGHKIPRADINAKLLITPKTPVKKQHRKKPDLGKSRNKSISARKHDKRHLKKTTPLI